MTALKNYKGWEITRITYYCAQKKGGTGDEHIDSGSLKKVKAYIDSVEGKGSP